MSYSSSVRNSGGNGLGNVMLNPGGQGRGSGLGFIPLPAVAGAVSIARRLFGGGPDVAAGTALPFGATMGQPFAESIRGVPTDVLQRVLNTRENPFGPAFGGPGRGTPLADSGLAAIRVELANRALAQVDGTARASIPGVAANNPVVVPGTGSSAVMPGAATATTGVFSPVVLLAGLGALLFITRKRRA